VDEARSICEDFLTRTAALNDLSLARATADLSTMPRTLRVMLAARLADACDDEGFVRQPLKQRS
jgi:hypothetical protein